MTTLTLALKSRAPGLVAVGHFFSELFAGLAEGATFVFDGRAGQTVTIGMASSAFDPYLVLRQAGSTSNIQTNDDGGGRPIH